MQAIEFESTLLNGQVTLPNHFSNWEGRHVKVILLSDEILADVKADSIYTILTALSDDFMSSGREQLPVQEREHF